MVQGAPPPLAPLRPQNQAGLFVVWVVAGVGLKSHKTSVELGDSFCYPSKEEQVADSGYCQQSRVYSGCCASALAFPQCPRQWQRRNVSPRKYLGFSSNSCCLCAEDMQEKGLDLLLK